MKAAVVQQQQSPKRLLFNFSKLKDYEYMPIVPLLIPRAKLKTKTNHMLPLLEEKRNDLILLKSRDQELQENQKQQQGHEGNLSEIQGISEASKRLSKSKGLVTQVADKFRQI